MSFQVTRCSGFNGSGNCKTLNTTKINCNNRNSCRNNTIIVSNINKFEINCLRNNSCHPITLQLSNINNLKLNFLYNTPEWSEKILIGEKNHHIFMFLMLQILQYQV